MTETKKVCVVCGQGKLPHCSRSYKLSLTERVHSICFKCQVCNVELTPSTYRHVAEKLWCLEHAAESVCAYCKHIIEDQSTVNIVDDVRIHKSHFFCEVCSVPVENASNIMESWDGYSFRCVDHFLCKYCMSPLDKGNGTSSLRCHQICLDLKAFFGFSVVGLSPREKIAAMFHKGTTNLEQEMKLSDQRVRFALANKIHFSLQQTEKVMREISERILYFMRVENWAKFAYGVYEFVQYCEILLTSMDQMYTELLILGKNEKELEIKDMFAKTNRFCKSHNRFLIRIKSAFDNNPLHRKADVGTTYEIDVTAFQQRFASYGSMLLRKALKLVLLLETECGKSGTVTSFLDRLDHILAIQLFAEQIEAEESNEYIARLSDLKSLSSIHLTCAKCSESINDMALERQLMFWHPSCARCSTCDSLIMNSESRGYRWNTATKSFVCETCRDEKIKDSNSLVDDVVEVSDIKVKIIHLKLDVLDFVVKLETLGAFRVTIEAKQPQLIREALRRKGTIRDKPEHDETPLVNIVRKYRDFDPAEMSLDSPEPADLAEQDILEETSGSQMSLDSRERSASAMSLNNLPSESGAGNGSAVAVGRLVKNPNCTYFGELSDSVIPIVRQRAISSLIEILKDRVPRAEVLDLTKQNKTDWINRFFGGNKRGKGDSRGTFGVDPEQLVEYAGIDSDLGVSDAPLRIPIFLDKLVRALRAGDLKATGIFRMSGNVGRLKSTSESLNKDPNYLFTKDTPIQLAALLKKWLREMPEPLLTFRLQKLFMVAIKHENEALRNSSIHYLLCLLPKTNRNILEVVCVLLHDVAMLSEHNLMPTANLATVIGPNIMFSKTRDPLLEDTAAINDLLSTILCNQEVFWTVPADIVPHLTSVEAQ